MTQATQSATDFLPENPTLPRLKEAAKACTGCLPWLEAELKVLRPKIIVCLGVSAARSVFGTAVRLKDYRATFSASRWGIEAFVTVHPSALLRLREAEERETEYQRFVSELKIVRERLARRE